MTKYYSFRHKWHQIYGHAHVKRALEVTAAGNLTIVLYGPRGTFREDLLRELKISYTPWMRGADLIETPGTSRGLFLDSCYCGNYGSPERPCFCPVAEIEAHYRKSILPVLHVCRPDILVPTPEPHWTDLTAMLTSSFGEQLHKVTARIDSAKAKLEEAKCWPPKVQQTSTLLKAWPLSKGGVALLESAWKKRRLTPRQVRACIHTSVVIAALDAATEIVPIHMSEAIQYQLGGPTPPILAKGE